MADINNQREERTPSTEPLVERRREEGTITDRRRSDTDLAMHRISDRVTEVEATVKAIVDSMPNKKIEDHEEYHKQKIEEAEVKKKHDEAARKIRNDLIVDLIKFSVKSLAAAVLAIFVLGMQTQFANMVNKAIDTTPAKVGVSK